VNGDGRPIIAGEQVRVGEETRSGPESDEVRQAAASLVIYHDVDDLVAGKVGHCRIRVPRKEKIDLFNTSGPRQSMERCWHAANLDRDCADGRSVDMWYRDDC
jgi:hypothetical protein